MAFISSEQSSSLANPLDLLEELVDANEWPFDRPTKAELVIEIAGRWSDYRLFFAWQEEMSAIYLSCRMDMRVPAAKRMGVAELLLAVNEKLWLGHFDLCSDESVPIFRHTLLLRGSSGISAEQLEDLVDIAASECERFYPAFQFLLWGGHSPKDALSAALLDTAGEA